MWTARHTAMHVYFERKLKKYSRQKYYIECESSSQIPNNKAENPYMLHSKQAAITRAEVRSHDLQTAEASIYLNENFQVVIYSAQRVYVVLERLTNVIHMVSTTPVIACRVPWMLRVMDSKLRTAKIKSMIKVLTVSRTTPEYI